MEVQSTGSAAEVWNRAIRRRLNNVAATFPHPQHSPSPWVDRLAIGAYSVAAFASVVFVIIISSQPSDGGSLTSPKTRPAMVKIDLPGKRPAPPPKPPAKPPSMPPLMQPSMPEVVGPPEKIEINPRPSAFVRARGSQLEVDCRPFYVAGFNAHDLVEISLLKPSAFKMENDISGHVRVRETLREASASGLNVVRIWGFTNHGEFPFQTEPGNYNEVALKGLDYVLNEARQFGMRVIIALTDNWKYLNGAGQYIDWSNTAPARKQDRAPDDGQEPADPNSSTYETMRHTLFFFDSGAKQHYRNHVKTILLRENHITGIQYKDDPTIFAWNLINEPRCRLMDSANCTESVQTWIEEMSEYTKSLDPNHMVTVGQEGFFAGGKPWSKANPGPWAEEVGQCFVENHSPKSIDFAAIHSWPDNWERPDLKFQEDWLKAHGDVSKEQLDKPLILEEFGKRLLPDEQDDLESIHNIRDPFFADILGTISSSITNDEGIVGALFWRLHLPSYAGHDSGRYGIRTTDSTFGLIKDFAHVVQSAIHYQPPRQECRAECWVPYSQEGRDFCVESKTACNTYWDVWNGHRKYKGMTIKDVNVTVWGQEVALTKLKFFASWSECCRKGLGAFEEGCSLDAGYSSW